VNVSDLVDDSFHATMHAQMASDPSLPEVACFGGCTSKHADSEAPEALRK
jgi:hypothetical protein